MSKNIGMIWGNAVSQGNKPFSKDYQNQDYQTYSEIAESKSIELFYGHYSWYENGKLEKAFRWTGTEWEEVHDVELDGAFDKFPFNEETEKVKESLNMDLPVVNDFELEIFCKDKLKSAQRLQDYFPDTSGLGSLDEMLSEFDRVVVKPRFGHGGEDVNIVDSREKLDLDEDIEYIVQEFVEASEVPIPGVSGKQHDLRVVFVNNEAVYTYIRTPEEEEGVSNVAKQGSITYIDLEDVPDEVMSAAREISEELEGYRPCLFSVDFIISKEGRHYVLELNSKPGMYFSDSEGKEKYERPGIESLIEALSQL